MSGGQHRDDEVSGPNRSGEVKRKEVEIARAIDQALLAQTHGCAQDKQKLRRNLPTSLEMFSTPI